MVQKFSTMHRLNQDVLYCLVFSLGFTPSLRKVRELKVGRESFPRSSQPKHETYAEGSILRTIQGLCGKVREAGSRVVVLCVFGSKVHVEGSKLKLSESYAGIKTIYTTNCRTTLFEPDMTSSALDGPVR